MNQGQKGNTDKTKLPVKTEFAAFWLLIFGACLIIGAVVFLVLSATSSPDKATGKHSLVIPYVLLLTGGILTTSSGIAVFKQSKHAWKVALVAMFFFEIAYALELDDKPDAFPRTLQLDSYTIPMILIVGVLAYLLPLLLIIQDRNTHLEMARKKEWEELKTEKSESNNKGNRHLQNDGRKPK